MRNLTTMAAILLTLSLSAGADVVKKSKSEVTFAKYGTFKTERVEVISINKKRVDSIDHFKGRGLLNKLAAKMFFKNGEFTRITNLDTKIAARVNHKKKRVKEREIKPMTRKDGDSGDDEDGSDITITRNRLTVSVTGQKKMVNGFPSKEYIVLWEVEWESNEGPKKGASKLVSNIWATPLTGTLATAQKVESLFFSNYMKALGLDTDFKRDEVLGGSWMRIFSSLSKSSSRLDSDKAEKFRKELLKIKGYPVIVDGEYFTFKTGGKKKKGLKGLLRKKKKEAEEERPKFAFYTEILELKLKERDQSDYEYPEGYKVK